MKHITKINTSSKSDEAYTPDWVLEYARKVICYPFEQERFDFDPFSDEDNNANAIDFLTINDNGFTTEWGIEEGSIWINPPFSKMAQVVPLIRDYAFEHPRCRIMMLCKADFRTKWSKELMSFAKNMVIINDYVRFSNATTSAPFSVVIYAFNVPPIRLTNVDDSRFVPTMLC